MATFKHPQYRYSFEVKSILKSLESLKENICTPFIMNAGTLDNHLFRFDDYHEYSFHIHNAVLELMNEVSGESNIWDVCKKVFVKDENWGKQRNQDLKYEAYFKYTLKPEHVESVASAVDQWISETKSIFEQMTQEENQKKLQQENERNVYAIVETYKIMHPSGGEDGIDGYFDGSIKNNSTGVIQRIVARNVFDFGFYTYPKRLEGTDGVFEKVEWTEEEKQVCNWLAKFSPFTTDIRM